MKILELFKLSKEERADKKVERLARALARKQQELLDKLDARKDDLIEKKETLENLSPDSVNENTWVTEYQEVLVELEVLNAEIAIAEKTNKEFFTSEGA